MELISQERVAELLKFGSVLLTIDGDCACALLGENLQNGEAEFVKIKSPKGKINYDYEARVATVKALRKLTARCYPKGDYSLPYNLSQHEVMAT